MDVKLIWSIMVHISRGFIKTATFILVEERKFIFRGNTAGNISKDFFTSGLSTKHDFKEIIRG